MRDLDGGEEVDVCSALKLKMSRRDTQVIYRDKDEFHSTEFYKISIHFALIPDRSWLNKPC